MSSVGVCARPFLTKTCRAFLAGMVAAVLVCHACAEPQLAITFFLPEGHGAELIEGALLRLLRVPELNPFDCDDLAFGRVSSMVIRSSVSVELSAVRDRAVTLEGIERQHRKIVWIQALDAEGTPIFAGCGELDEVLGNERLSLRGEPVAMVHVPVTQEVESALSFGSIGEVITLDVSDTLGEPLGGIDVRWEIVGAKGQKNSGAARTDATGRVEIRPQPPGPGPARVECRVRWQLDPSPIIHRDFYPGTQLSDDLNHSMRKPDLKIARLGPNGVTTLLALDVSSSAVPYEIVYRSVNAGTNMFVGDEILVDPKDGQRPLAGVVPGPDGDHLIFVSDTIWQELDPSSGSLIARAVPENMAPPKGLTVLPACAEPAEEGLVLLDFGDVLGVYDRQGLAHNDHPLAAQESKDRVLVSGCVHDQDGEPYPIVIFSSEEAPSRIVVVHGNQLTTIYWKEYLNAVAFSPLSLEDGGALLLASDGATGPVISWLRLRRERSAGTMWLQKVREDPVYSAPFEILCGDVDGDGRADSVAHIDLWDGYSSFLQVVLATEHNGRKLTGSLLPTDVWRARGRPVSAVVDVDGDSVDDIVFLVSVVMLQQDNSYDETTLLRLHLMGG